MARKTKKTNGLRNAARPLPVRKSSGNVFADLGLAHPEQELLKAQLTLQIYRLIRRLGITQAEAGKILGIKQPHVSALMRNRAGSFSVERLMEFLTALGQDIEITVRPARKSHGAVSVMV
jgi:predicted XRE-type DNA-binding protein